MDTYTARKIVSLAALAAAFAAGCANNKLPPISANSYFDADDAAHPVDNLMAQQIANGAREDGTLYPQHFTDGKLNSLGYAKLGNMTSTPNTGKLAIFIDVPKGDAYTSAQDSVSRAMKRNGFADDAYTVTAGPNTTLSAPAGQGMQALSKMHGGSSDTSSSPDTGTINPTGK